MTIAAELIDVSISQAKKTFFPVNRKFWLKIGLVSLCTAKHSSNFNFRNGDFTKITKVVDFIKKYIYYFAAGLGVLFILGIIFSAISYVFNFVFIES